MKKKVKHFTVNDLKQLFGDAFAPQKECRESKKNLFNSHKNN